MSQRNAITTWDPEDKAFWESQGQRIARRNMWTSVFAEHIGFSVWSMWAVLALFMTKKTGFTLTPSDKILLVSAGTLVAATVQPLFAFVQDRFGGHRLTTTT